MVNTQERILWWLQVPLFYAVLGLLVVVLAGCLIVTIVKQKTVNGKIRSGAGALLPLLLLVFTAALFRDSIKTIEDWLRDLPLLVRLAGGAAIAAVMLEVPHWLPKNTPEMVLAVFALLLSTLISFIVWCVIGGITHSLGMYLLGFTVAAGLHIVLRGLPGTS